MSSLEWFEGRTGRFQGDLKWNERLSKHTYYQIGGPAELLAVPQSLEDLKILKEGLRESGAPFYIIGAGTNLLISDQGFAGVVIKTTKMNLEIKEKSLGQEKLAITVGSSVSNSTLLSKAMREGWKGLEFLVGIPGSAGGAVSMNAGTHLGETEAALLSIEIFDLSGAEQSSLTTLSRSELLFEYRKNHTLRPGMLVWSVTWQVQKADPLQVKTVVEQNLLRRKATQPVELPSCGSVFKNPNSSGLHAWQVIDRLGLRGYRLGGAGFSEKHCNFIVNYGGAQAKDVLALIVLAKERAQTELGIELEEEVKLIGF